MFHNILKSILIIFTLRSWNISTVAIGLLDQIILSLGNVIVNNTNFDDISFIPMSGLNSFIDYTCVYNAIRR